MLSKDDALAILHFAVQAPSGDNAQPWRFEVSGDGIDFFNIPGQDRSPYNFRERGSFFAHGAAIENAVIAAADRGYVATVTLFPEGDADKTHVAHVALAQTKPPVDPLLAFVATRTTNRHPYKKMPLPLEHYEVLSGIFPAGSDVKLLLIDDPQVIKKFSQTVSLSDRLIFEEKSIHDAIFSSIRWTDTEEHRERGMYIKTLELPPPARVIFRLVSNWKTLTALNHIGISKFIAAQSAKVYATAPVIGMVVIPTPENRNYVAAGRLFQRFWLTATQLGVSIQPVTALAYLAGRIAIGDAGELSPRHAEEVVSAQKKIDELFGRGSGAVALMFRMGYGPVPSAHSRKSEPQVIVKG